MTIASTESEVEYAGNGITTVFAIPFVFDTPADLKVVETDADGTATEVTTGFSISGGGGGTGSLTRSVALPSGQTITILDDPDLTQPADYRNNDSFPAETHESALDRTVRLIKRLSQQTRSFLRVVDGDPSVGDGMQLAPVLTRANKYLRFDNDGNADYSSTTAVRFGITSAEIAVGLLGEDINTDYPPGDIRRYGAVADGSTDDSEAVRLACDVYAEDTTLQFVSVYGRFYCATDVPDIHDVQLEGPGYIKVGTGNPWYANANTFNTSFSTPMLLYIDPAGSDSNSGLSSAFPLLTLQAAADIIEKRAPIEGHYRITLAAGTYTAGATFIGLRNFYLDNPLYISGPVVSAWDKTDKPANVSDTGGSIPTAIFDGSGQGSGFAITAFGSHLWVEDIKFTDWGTEATDSDDGAVRAKDWSMVTADNCHVWNSTNATMGRENSYIRVRGGYYNNNRRGCFVIMARYAVGYQSSSAGDTTAPLFEENTFGVDVWEMGNGHADYAHFLNNGTHILVRKNSHVAMNGPTFERTTGTVIGIQVQDGGNYRLDGNEVWTGTHTPRVKKFNYGVNADDTYTSWLVVGAGTQTATSDTNEHTLGSGVTIPRQCFNGGTSNVQLIKITAWGSVTNTNSTITFRVRIGSSTLTCTLALNGTTHNWAVDALIFATAADVQRSKMHLRRFDSTGTTAIIDDSILQTTEDVTAADPVCTFSVQAANASDSVIGSACIYEKCGF